MNSATDSVARDGASGKVLLVGDIDKAFWDADHIDRYPCEARANILEAIDVAAKRRFDTIGVVMDGIAGQLGSVLKALRKSTAARIILFAQMYEEPIARRLTSENCERGKAADAYAVCPISLASFCRDIKFGPDDPSGALSEWQPVEPKLERRLRYLERLATTDDLTGLKNRRYVWEFARQILAHARQTRGRVTLLVFDIDNFKHYNDVYGHSKGDEILKEAAILMQRSCRPHDVVGRIGGDEFAVVFWDDPLCTGESAERDRRSAETDHPKESLSVARRFQKEFGNAELRLLGPGGEGVLTISGALASFPRDGSTIQELFERADKALLEVKHSGKNRIYLVGEPQGDVTDIE